MPKNNNIEKLADVTSKAVEKATGNSWSEWIEYLDRAGASEMEHSEITRLLKSDNLTSWWQQKIASGYRTHKGLRKKGQTANIFQAGARKVFSMPLEKAWDFITSPEIAELWNKGNKSEDEIKVFKPNSHFRISWKQDDMPEVSTLQVRVLPNNEKTTVSFLHTNLRDEIQQKGMKNHWKKVVEELFKIAEKYPPNP